MFRLHDLINVIMTQKLSVSPSLIISCVRACKRVRVFSRGGRETEREGPEEGGVSPPGVPLAAEAEQPDAPDTGTQQRCLCGTAARG